MRTGHWAWIGLVAIACIASQVQAANTQLDSRIGQLEKELA